MFKKREGWIVSEWFAQAYKRELISEGFTR